MDVKLVVVGGKSQAAEYPLALPAIVGRSRSANLPLNHPLVSRQHCELFEANGRLMVRDLGSLNGTFVGDTRIADEVVVAPGGLLTIGSVTFRAVYGKMPVNGAEDAPDFSPVGDTGEIDQTIESSDVALLAAGPGAETEEAAASDTSDEAFNMSWLQDDGQPEESDVQRASPPTESAPARNANPAAPEDLGDADVDVPDYRTPAPDEAAEAIEDEDRGEASEEEVNLAESARAIERGEEDSPEPAKPAEGGEDDLDDFFRSLSEP